MMTSTSITNFVVEACFSYSAENLNCCNNNEITIRSRFNSVDSFSTQLSSGVSINKTNLHTMNDLKKKKITNQKKEEYF